MRKFLLLFTLLLTTVQGWAQEQVSAMPQVGKSYYIISLQRDAAFFYVTASGVVDYSADMTNINKWTCEDAGDGKLAFKQESGSTYLGWKGTQNSAYKFDVRDQSHFYGAVSIWGIQAARYLLVKNDKSYNVSQDLQYSPLTTDFSSDFILTENPIKDKLDLYVHFYKSMDLTPSENMKSYIEQVANCTTDQRSTLANNIKGEFQNCKVKAGYYKIQGSLGTFIANTTIQDNNNTKSQMTADGNVAFITEDGQIIWDNNKIQFSWGNKDAQLNDLSDNSKKFTITPKFDGVVLKQASANSYLWGHTANKLDRYGSEVAGKTQWRLYAVTDDTQKPCISKDFTKGRLQTISAPVALKIPSGVVAYTMSKITDGGDNVKLTKITTGIIPAGTGAIVYYAPQNATDATQKFYFDGTAYSAQEGAIATCVFQSAQAPAGSYYLSSPAQGEATFKKATGSEEALGANTAYVTLEGVSAETLNLEWNNGEKPTGISTAVAKVGKTVYYNLNGVQVKNPTKGIYVTSEGKKVIF